MVTGTFVIAVVAVVACNACNARIAYNARNAGRPGSVQRAMTTSWVAVSGRLSFVIGASFQKRIGHSSLGIGPRFQDTSQLRQKDRGQKNSIMQTQGNLLGSWQQFAKKCCSGAQAAKGDWPAVCAFGCRRGSLPATRVSAKNPKGKASGSFCRTAVGR